MKVYPKKRKAWPPWVRVFKSIARNSKLSLQARHILTIIKSYGNSDGTHCFPSFATIMDNAGCSRSSLKRFLNELRKAGLIYAEQRITKGKKKSSCTFLLYDDLRARHEQKPRSTRGPRKGPPAVHGEAQKILPFTEEIAASL